MLHQGQAGRRLEVWPGFLLEGMGRVVGGDHVDAAVAHALEQAFPVVARLDGGIALDAAAQVRVAGLVEPEVMDADFGGDALVRQGSRLEEFQFPCRGEVQHMQPGPVPPGEVHRQGG